MISKVLPLIKNKDFIVIWDDEKDQSDASDSK